MIAPELERQLQAIKSEKPFINTVHKELQKIIASGNFSLKMLSQKLGLSERTLQRKLKKEHTTCKEELQAVQFEMAIFLQHKKIKQLKKLPI